MLDSFKNTNSINEKNIYKKDKKSFNRKEEILEDFLKPLLSNVWLLSKKSWHR